MLVSVIFYKDYAKAYGGRAYTYRTDMPLKKGDVVFAPTATGESQRALVVKTDVSERDVADYADRLLAITEYFRKGAF